MVLREPQQPTLAACGRLLDDYDFGKRGGSLFFLDGLKLNFDEGASVVLQQAQQPRLAALGY